VLNGIRIRDPSNLVAAEIRRRPNGHQDGRDIVGNQTTIPRLSAYSLYGLNHPGAVLGVGTLGCYLDIEETALNTAEC
jgi:hypothetical protein